MFLDAFFQDPYIWLTKQIIAYYRKAVFTCQDSGVFLHQGTGLYNQNKGVPGPQWS